MTSAFLRNTTAFIVALMGAALLGGTAPATGASITYSDPACASFTVTGSSGNYTLVCSKLACSIAASPSSPLQLGTSTTLTANCSPSGQGYTYTWTASAGNDQACRGAPSSTTNVGTVQAPQSNAAAAGCVYQVDVNGGANGNGMATTSLTWQAALPQAPSGCSITPNPSPLPSGGGTVNLTASCSGGDPVSNYHWTASPSTAGFPSDAGASASATISGTTAFTVVASNSGGSSQATTSVQVGGSAGGISCAAQGFTKTMSYTWNWANGGMTINTYNDPQGPIGSNGIVVIAFTPTAAVLGSAGTASIAPYPPPAESTTRTSTISTTPCTLSAPSPWQHVGSDAATAFTVGVYNTRLYPALVAGQTYYINIANRNGAGAPTCAGSACDIRVQLSRPTLLQ